MEGSIVTGAPARARYGREVTTMGHAWHEFRVKPAPWVIAAGIVVMSAIRLLVGGFSWRDALAVAGMLVVYPFGEWAIHVHLLHLRPFELRGRRVDLATARSHREHHEQPNDLDLINFAPLEAVAILVLAAPAVPLLVAALTAVLPGPVPWGALATATLTGYVLVAVYEWTHFLIHTAYRPRSRYYRSIWRNHRLHHFKNEHYWHGITNTVSDRALGTFPEQAEVPRSPTARRLEPS
jgi:hypothetical protein